MTQKIFLRIGGIERKKIKNHVLKERNLNKRSNCNIVFLLKKKKFKFKVSGLFKHLYFMMYEIVKHSF